MSACPSGLEITEANCADAALAAGYTSGRGLQVGSWGSVAAGCSVQTGGDNAAHYNSHPNPTNDGSYSLLCYKGGSNYHTAQFGAHECDYGQSVAQSECEAVIGSLYPGGSSSMTVGNGGTCLDGAWGQVPLGCSVQAGSLQAHFKTSGDTGAGCIHSQYQLVCTEAVSHTYVQLESGKKCLPESWPFSGAPFTLAQCFALVQAEPTCLQNGFFNHNAGGDGNCGCVASIKEFRWNWISQIRRFCSRFVLGPNGVALFEVVYAYWGSGTPEITNKSSVSRFLDPESSHSIKI